MRLIPPIGRPKASLVDMDGTLVSVAAIRYFVDPNSDYVKARGGDKDFNAFHQASRHAPAIQQALDFCARHHAAGNIIVVGTARAAMHYDVSKGWLDDYLLPICPYDGPIMVRKDGDRRSDVVIKRTMYQYLSLHYDIVAAADDRPEICDLWRELCVPEIEVVPGWNADDGCN